MLWVLLLLGAVMSICWPSHEVRAHGQHLASSAEHAAGGGGGSWPPGCFWWGTGKLQVAYPPTVWLQFSAANGN